MDTNHTHVAAEDSSAPGVIFLADLFAFVSARRFKLDSWHFPSPLFFTLHSLPVPSTLAPTMSTILRFLQALLFGCQGYLLEGNLFAVLLSSTFIVRSFEFALADGAVDCTNEFDSSRSYAHRLWTLISQDPSVASQLLLFDMKSSCDDGEGAQRFKTSVGQQNRVAFFLCICAADPRFVDLMPNMSQNAEALKPGSELPVNEQDQVTIDMFRPSRLFAMAHGSLHQGGTPFRMPISMLPEAIHRVRDCALGQGNYANPWTGVEFKNWRPLTTQQTRWLKPTEDSSHFTAFEEAMRIYQAVTFHSNMTFDLLGLQPCLADIKLFPLPGSNRQVYVQHKIDGHERAKDKPLARVYVLRDGVYYFDAQSRFDFLMFHFELGRKDTERVFFFLPERLIPDAWYTSVSGEVSFARPEFEKFRVVMDDNMEWVGKIQSIILQYEEPRKPGERPVRALTETTGAEVKAKMKSKTKAKKLSKAEQALHNGKRDWERAMVNGHRQFFYAIMRECCNMGSGLLVEFARNHPDTDFGFMRYSWSSKEQEAYLNNGDMPRVGHSLPREACFVPICYYARHQEVWFHGPKLTGPQFRRLNSSQQARLVVFDLSGPDSTSPRLTIIPSEDIQPTPSQSQRLRTYIGGPADWDKHTPNISALLATDLFASEYGIARGPLGSHEDMWRSIWEKLNSFACPFGKVEHPVGFVRDGSKYRHTIHDANVRLLQQLDLVQLGVVEESSYEESD